MPHLTPQPEAAALAALAAWQQYEESILRVLVAAGCSLKECAAVMAAEVN